MIDQKAIAAAAGVSRATVSRAFTQNANISPKTMEKIQNAMKELGLDPIPWYPSSNTKKSRYVVVIAGDVANEFYSQIIKGICDTLQSMGLFAIVCNSNYDSRLEEEQIRFAQESDCLGLVLVTAFETDGLVELLKNSSIPVILVNRYIHSLDMDIVCIDNYSGGYMAASCLLQNNHKRIAHLAGEANSTPQQDRVRGFRDAIRDFGFKDVVYDVFYGEQTTKRGQQFADNLIFDRTRYSAVFAPSCPIASGLVNRLRNNNFNIPEELSVICFDDSILIDERGLNLTTISYDPYQMGVYTAETLIRRLEGKGVGKYKLLLEPKLQERGSVKALDAK